MRKSEKTLPLIIGKIRSSESLFRKIDLKQSNHLGNFANTKFENQKHPKTYRVTEIIIQMRTKMVRLLALPNSKKNKTC